MLIMCAETGFSQTSVRRLTAPVVPRILEESASSPSGAQCWCVALLYEVLHKTFYEAFYYLPVHPVPLLDPALMNGLHKSCLMCFLHRRPSCSWPGSGPRITPRTKTVKKRSKRSDTSKSSHCHPCLLCWLPADPFTIWLTLNLLSAGELLGRVGVCVLSNSPVFCYQSHLMLLGDKLL